MSMFNPTFLLRPTGYCTHVSAVSQDLYETLRRKYSNISISIKKNNRCRNNEQVTVFASTASGYSIRVWNNKMVYNTVPSLFREYMYLSNKLGCPLTPKQASKVCELINSFRDRFKKDIDRLIIYY